MGQELQTKCNLILESAYLHLWTMIGSFASKEGRSAVQIRFVAALKTKVPDFKESRGMTGLGSSLTAFLARRDQYHLPVLIAPTTTVQDLFQMVETARKRR